MRFFRGVSPLAWLGLGVIVVAGLALRLINIDYGLPYVYNYDEDTHFTNRAVEMFGNGTLDPGYYQNPSDFTYLVYAALRLRFGDLPVIGPLSDLPFDSIGRQFAFDPTPIWETARGLSALICMAGVIAVFYVGRRLWGAAEGLVAAAIMSFTFLPVVYSRIAVTDVGTFLPVALATYAAIRVHEGGGRRYYVLAGAMTGLAIGFKYTSGLVLLPLGIAAFIKLRAGDRTVIRNAIFTAGATFVVFFLTNPYFFFEIRKAAYGLVTQADQAGGIKKFGQEQTSGFLYYLDSLTWGFGWVPLVAAVAGGVILFRRDRMRAVLLLSFPVVLYLYLSIQSRYFGRWLLPAYPVLALLCGVALVQLARRVRTSTAMQGLLVAGLLALVLVQPVLTNVRVSKVLGREDTRSQARDFVTKRFGPELRMAIEPAVPDSYFRLTQPRLRGAAPDTCTGFTKLRRGGEASGDEDCLPVDRRQFIRGYIRDMRRSVSTTEVVGMTAYAETLRPETIDFYREEGFCLVTTMSLVRGRAENAKDPRALAYYRRLERESDLVYRAEPYKKGEGPVKLHFDLSYNYYPTAFDRPGADVRVYRLRDCKQQFGRVPEMPRGLTGIDKGIGTSFSGFEKQ